MPLGAVSKDWYHDKVGTHPNLIHKRGRGITAFNVIQQRSDIPFHVDIPRGRIHIPTYEKEFEEQAQCFCLDVGSLVAAMEIFEINLLHHLVLNQAKSVQLADENNQIKDDGRNRLDIFTILQISIRVDELFLTKFIEPLRERYGKKSSRCAAWGVAQIVNRPTHSG